MHVEKPTTTPLIEAAAMGNIEMMQLLLDSGANTNLRDNRGNTPLHRAARKGNLAAVTLLCRSGSATDVKNTRHRTPLMEARRHGHSAVVQYLLQRDVKEEVQSADEDASTLVPASPMARGIPYTASGYFVLRG